MSKFPVFKLNELALEWCKGQPFKKTDISAQGANWCIHYGELFTKYGVVIASSISKTNVQGKRVSVSGDILFPASDVTPSGLARCSALMQDNVILGGDIIIMRPRPGNDPRYLSYAINYQKEQILRRVTGALIKHLSSNALKSVVIPIPPLEKQIDLVEKLDKISTLIAHRNLQLQKLNQLASSRFIEMFGDPIENPKGWKQSTIGKECFYIKDGPHKSPPYVEEGIPFISTRNVVAGDGIDWQSAKYISEADYQECIRKCHPEKGDILYSKGGTTGIARLVETDRKFANWVHVAVLKFGQQLNGKFFESMLNSKCCYLQSQRLTKGIANRDFVLSSIAQVIIIVPPIELQNEFAAFIEQLDKSKLAAEEQGKKLEKIICNDILQKRIRE